MILTSQPEYQLVPRPSLHLMCSLVSWPPLLLPCQPDHQVLPRRPHPLVRLFLSLITFQPEHQLKTRLSHWPVFAWCLGLHLCWPVSQSIGLTLNLFLNYCLSFSSGSLSAKASASVSDFILAGIHLVSQASPLLASH